MRGTTKRGLLALAVAAFGLATSVAAPGADAPARPPAPDIPKVWDDEALRTWALPLAGLGAPPTYVASADYYAIPERTLHRSYPVYALGKEPSGYMEWLSRQRPEVAFDASKLKTEADWIAAGAVVFDAVDETITVPRLTGTVEMLHDPAYYRDVEPRAGSDGVISGMRYVVNEKGEVRVGLTLCSVCHTRVLADGRVVPGAPGNGQIGRRIAFNLGRLGETARGPASAMFADSTVPWLTPDPAERLRSISFADELELYREARQPGVFPRVGASPLFPPRTPDLIGVRDRQYLDATGLLRNRGVGDLMRYATSVASMERTTTFGRYKIYPEKPPSQQPSRLSDAQLYALALYIYSLAPPENPNRPSELSRRGEKVFAREGCAGCHTPPLYTNNKLSPAVGYEVPESQRTTLDSVPFSVGTDPRLALASRKGTGFYKVPSLKGVWYRGPFEHNGSVATLEDWFDPRRLRDDYVPTGFKGFGVTHRAVKGHEFGLSLSADDRRALVAFLRTL